MKRSFRLFAIAATAVIGVGSLTMLAGCTTDNPEVTITYEFNGEEYEVAYRLSRKGAPQTVQHFIELADAGYYNATVIHDYRDGFLYGGGYVLDGSELTEKNYWEELQKYEKEHDFKFTQTVFANGADMSGYFTQYGGYTVAGESFTASDTRVPLYTVHGEFGGNGVEPNSKTIKHQKGVLAMYYTGKGSDDTRVRTVRTDGGANNNKQPEQDGDPYKTNCATSLFYTWTGTSGGTAMDEQYATIGLVIDYADLQALLDAISDYTAELDVAEGETPSFTETITFHNVNQYDPIDHVRNAGISAEYNVPVSPITVKTVKVNKY